MAIITIGFNPAIDRILECAGFHIGGHQQARQVARLAAGKAANVSRALAQLGVDSIATGFVGRNEGEFFHDQLMSAGPGRVLCRFVEVGGRTRENITILDSAAGTETHLRDRGFEVTRDEIGLLERKVLHELKAGDVAVFSGSLCAGMTAEDLGKLIDLCAQQQAKIAVDANGAALKPATEKRLWLLKPNLEELRELTGAAVADEEATIRNAATPLLRTVEYVLVTRGALGALLVTQHSAYRAQLAVRKAPVRTVGCGDYLLAGLVAEVSAGRNVDRALQFAMAVATARAFSTRMEEFDPTVFKTALENVHVEQI